MYVHLISPFRTSFNLNTDAFNSRLFETANILSEVAYACSKVDSWECHSLIKPSQDGFRKFTTLNFDHSSLFSIPVFRLHLSNNFIENVYEHATSASMQILSTDFVQSPIRIMDSHIDIYDNTIAILNVTAQIEDPKQYLSYNKQNLDSTLSELSSQSARLINKDVISHLLFTFEKIERNKKGFFSNNDRLLLPPTQSSAYDDVSWSIYPNWPADIDPLLWASRTIELAKFERSLLADVLDWANITEQEREKWMSRESFFVSQYGTNVFYNDPTVDDFLQAARGMQYFTTLFDVLNDSQSRMYTELSYHMSSRDFNDIAQKSIESSSFVDYVLNEFNDFLFGLQSFRKLHSEYLFHNYSMPVQIQNLKERKDAVKAKIDRLFLQRNRFSQKGMEAALVAIGGIALVDFGLAISVAAQSTEEIRSDGFLGLIDVARFFPVDGILVSLLIFIIILSVFYGFRRR